jgi:hypothetical protein
MPSFKKRGDPREAPSHSDPDLALASRAALDADVLVAAQAAEIHATVVTNNRGHIGRWVPVHKWP